MSPEQWSQAKALFGTLVERDATEWSEVLSGETDPEIVAEVQRLLAAHATGAEFLADSPAESLSGNDPLLGNSLGPFRIEALLGEGGGGRVYRATRTDVGGQVAVKILRARFANAEARRRFQAEQSILARLDHPNIARLLQVGITDDGTPWLAMEYVEGTPFSEAMASRTIAERVRMIIKLLGAVDYAHRQLVVHRDIKPGNILVDQRDEPRLLDFGIAKRMDDAHLTNTQFQPRTPAYAAPEQVLGEPISVATDVYAMGVLLYEVLCGQHPWLNSGRNIDDAILAGDAALPSSRMQGPESRRLQGDLDAIVLQAMDRDPARRYRGAAAMAEDLQRYLDNRPVLAQKQTWLYRWRRFLQRNWQVVGAGAVAVAVLGLALGHEHRLRSAAALEAEKATEVAAFMLEVFAAGDSLGTGFTLTKDSTVMDLMARGVTRLESLQSAPLVRAELAHSMGQVYWGYSEYGEAEKLFRSALSLRRAQQGDSNDTAESLLMLGRVFERTGRFAEMVEVMQSAHAIRMRLLGPDHPATIHALHRVAASHYMKHELDRAAALAVTAIDAWQAHLPDHALDLANSHTIRALSLLRMGQFEEALRNMDQVIALRDAALPANHNLVGEGYINRARVHYVLGSVDEALSDARRALEITQPLYKGDHWDLVQQYEKLAQYLAADGALAEAVVMAEQGVAMARRLHQRTPNPEVVDVALHAQIVVLRAQGKHKEALPLAREVVQSREQRVAPSNTNLLDTRAVLADLLRLSGDPSQAEKELMRALDGWRERPSNHAIELVATLALFARIGHCDWLQFAWPEQMSPPMTQVIERSRQACAG